MNILLTVTGLALLLAGGEAALRGAVGLARRLGVSPALIGLVVVSIGTSAPELMVTLKAGIAGEPGLALGNVVGSNIANALLIGGVTGLFVTARDRAAAPWRDAAAMLAATVWLAAAGMTGQITAWQGGAMLLALCAFLLWAGYADRCGCAESTADGGEDIGAVPGATPMILLILALGLAGLLCGAELMLRGAMGIAMTFGVAESVVGLTIVAIGTSLPELAASAMAAIRRHGDLAVANIVGSSLFNILLILGATAVAAPLSVPEDIARIDLWVVLAAAAAFAALTLTGRGLSRWRGGLLLLGYGTYMATMGLRAGL